MDPASRPAPRQRYLVGLGSNRPHPRHGPPRRVLAAALEAIATLGPHLAASAVFDSAPLGPSRRRFANAVAVLESELDPLALLAALKRIERAFGRRPGGRRWGARVLDLDLLLWSGGPFAAPGLTVPHPALCQRRFVLAPALAVAADWRDPASGLTLRQAHARLTRPRPLPKAAGVAGP